jgi:dUTP pyrophosphatase
MDIQIKLINSNLELPKYQTDGSAGVDLYACIDKPLILVPDGRSIIKTGISLFIQDINVCGIILPRSGLSTKHGIILSNIVGLIDADYQGEMIIPIWNSGMHTYIIQPMERIAQIVFMPIIKSNFKVVSEFSNATKRGKNGFGSTGKVNKDE